MNESPRALFLLKAIYLSQILLNFEHQYGPWIVTHKGDDAVRRLLDDHYSRQTPGAKMFCRPGNSLVLRNADATTCWISWYSRSRDDGLDDVYECTAFRSTSEHLSSELINWAVYATLVEWGHKFPSGGFITYVDDRKVVPKQQPGFCYLKAGFKVIGRSKARKLLLLHHKIERNYIARKVAAGIKSIQDVINVALESGEYEDALYFQQLALSKEGWLQQLQDKAQGGGS